MTAFKGLRLSAYYLNTRRLEAVTGQDIPVAAQHSLVKNSDERVQGMRVAQRLADRLLRSGTIPNLTREHILGGEDCARLIGAVWGVFSFRGVSAAMMAEREGKKAKAASFSGKIPLGAEEFEMFGELKNDHLVSTTSMSILSGRKRMLVAGEFEFGRERVEVRPYIIGDLIQDMSGLPFSLSSMVRIYPEQIDAFAAMKDQRNPKTDELRKLQTITEDQIKHAFAEIIGEPYVPKDWGGEKSDLSSGRLTIGGEPTSAAFIFKGPSVSGSMHLSKMGKNGDQLVRAFDEPVDLVVVQHCNQIANDVVRVAEALAYNLGGPRRYCIIDGADTVKILKSYGKFGGYSCL